MYITVAQVNDSPTAVDDAFTVQEDSSGFTGSVLGGSLSGGVPDSDPENHLLTVTLLTGPTNGVLNLKPDGTFSFVPNPDYNGADSFTYQISDGFGGVDTATGKFRFNLAPLSQQSSLLVFAKGNLTEWRFPLTAAATAFPSLILL